MKKIKLAILTVIAIYSTNCQSQTKKMDKEEYSVNKTEQEWKSELTAEEYAILRGCGTEPAFTGKYWQNTEEGTYYCAACNTELFSSQTKYKSGSGWPSFWEPVDEDNVKIKIDKSLGMVREEVVCGNCGGHLGHRFNDGPQPTGQRYCVNSASLDFKEKQD
jgi:peptide-methionine (R)-S-oxide reductase